MNYASKYCDFSFESFTKESEFSKLLGMIYFLLYSREIEDKVIAVGIINYFSMSFFH